MSAALMSLLASLQFTILSVQGKVHALGVHLRNSTVLAERLHPMLRNLLHTQPYPKIENFLRLAVEYAGCTSYPQFLQQYYPDCNCGCELPALMKDLLRQARRDSGCDKAVDVLLAWQTSVAIALACSYSQSKDSNLEQC